jgi:hypothetical protein
LAEFILIWLLLLGVMGAGAAFGQSGIATTQLSDTVHRADGTAASGTVLVSWPTFTTASGASVAAGNTSVTLGTGGTLSLQLVPNAGSTPMGSYYTVVYHLDDGSVIREYWVVPVSTAPVQVSTIRSTVLPATVAMQTVSKAYVDTAITAALAGHPLDTSTGYVLKTGDTMTGPLVLPADPTSALQASDKNYVDTQVAGVTAGLGQKVSLSPLASQTVTQPVGTSLGVTNLSGVEYASQFVNGAGNNGIANAVATADCTNGCTVVVEPTYSSTEGPQPTTWPLATHVQDKRNGTEINSYRDPRSPVGDGQTQGQEINLVATESAAATHAYSGSGLLESAGLVMNLYGLTGGNNTFPESVQATVPYLKSTYKAEDITGTYNTPGQHVQISQNQNCFGVGDCLMGSRYMLTSGGFRDNADEGAHPFDLVYLEDSRVFEGTCQSGCTPGSTEVQLTPTANGGTQGEGRYLIDLNPAHVVTTGTITGGSSLPGRQPLVTFSGTSFPVSTLLETAQTITTQVNVIQPGTVTVAIVTSGVPAGFQTNTAALPAASGVACVTDVAVSDGRPLNYEMGTYSTVDGSHLTMTLNRAHAAGATIAVGGMCGYGIEETADTTNGIRQVFPIVASTSATSLLYAGGNTPVVGLANSTGSYLNVNAAIATISRTGNVVTVTTAGSLPDVNGTSMTVAGVTDSSYNGTFPVTTTGSNSLTYAQTGANSTSAGGTLGLVTGGYALYPMAEVLGVYNTTTKAVDGQMNLAANNVPWATNDPVEQPHYFQERVAADVEDIAQYTARPLSQQSAGIQYQGNNGPGLRGWQINNATNPAVYIGGGGTRTAPDAAFESLGVWTTTLNLTAGVQSVMAVHCNLHGCGRWDSAYDLVDFDNSGGGIDSLRYAPSTSNFTINMRGTQYNFTPQAFAAGTITVGTLNATTVQAAAIQGSISASSLPVFGASGSAHAPGAVPDPGATAGTTRFLREDGTWDAVSGGGGGGAVASVNGQTGSVVVDAAGAAAAVQTNLNATNSTVAAQAATLAALAPVATSGNAKDISGVGGIPQRTNLLAEYLLNEGTGTVAHDTSGQGNNGTISGATWESTTDLNFTSLGQYVQMPVAVNQANTFQFAIYAPPFGSGSGAQPPGYGIPGGFGLNPSLLCGTDTAHTCFIPASFVSGPKSQRMYAFNSSHTESAETLSAGWHVVTLVSGSSGALDHVYYDGAEVNGYIAQGSGSIAHPATGNYQIGGSSAYTGTWWLGKVAAAWAWSTALSSTDVQAAATAATAYVRGKGGFVTYRPAPHDAGLIIGGMDSRTAGSNGLSSPAAVWLANLTLTDSTYTTLDLGMPGSMDFDVAAMFDTLYGPSIGQNSGPTIVVLWGGVNDFPHGPTSRQIANYLKTMTQKAKALGARVIVATDISSGSGGDAYKDGVDPIIRAEAFSWGADNIADLATIPQLGADGAYANTTYFADTLHPTNTGEAFLDVAFSDAINELLGSNETTNRHQTSATTYAEAAGDRFLDLTGTAAQTITLPSCIGYSLPRQIVNVGSATAAVGPVSGQTLTGSTAIGVNVRAMFSPIAGALATSGCSWERTQ